ncbi:alpha/beta fold hydrolase [Nonomuraea sp. NPDC049649]|uniref:alpha/beta fold hydrolase n=1 Tax=Nonomuraea sp. NPDC049649 TaxID=3155776 RepID=UPI00341CE4F1
MEGGRDDAPGGAVLVVPGFGELAREYAWLIESLAPRRVVAVDLRGRGPSDVPDSGYDLADHVCDLEAVAEAAGLRDFTVVAISRGVSYGLGYALRHPCRVRGFLAGDYGAEHVALPEAWPRKALSQVLRGVPIPERVAPHAVRAIQREAVDRPMWDRLGELRGPFLVVRGTRRSVLVTDATADRYREALPGVEVHTLEGLGHDLWNPDHRPLLGLVESLLGRVWDAEQGD